VPAGLAPADEDAVLVIGFDSGQSAEVGGIRVDGEDARTDFDAALALGAVVEAREFIRDAAAALAESDND